jgi:hypothetical protein
MRCVLKMAMKGALGINDATLVRDRVNTREKNG